MWQKRRHDTPFSSLAKEIKKYGKTSKSITNA